jgi:hypothetical protein
MRHLSPARASALVLTVFLAACGDGDEPLDPEDEAFTGGKADGFCVAEDSADAAGILALVNDDAVDVDELDRPVGDHGAGLNRKAAEGIVAARPLGSLAALDAVPFVGLATCGALRDYACDTKGLCQASMCSPDELTKLPHHGKFDATCEAMVLELVGRAASERGEGKDVAPDARCEELDGEELSAFDFVAAQFGVPVAELADSFEALSVSRTRFSSGSSVLDVIELEDGNSGSSWLAGFADGKPSFLFSTDFLGASTDWYCAAGGATRAEPAEFCLLDVVRTACDAGPRTHDTLQVAATTDLAALDDPTRAAIGDYRSRFGVANQAPLSLDRERCGTKFERDTRAGITVTSAGAVTASYEIADTDAGANLLSVSQGASSQLVCETVTF